MPSPFPGMDPYLEDSALWPGLHQSLITYIRDTLTPAVRPEYSARIGKRVYVVQPQRSIIPDVTLLQQPTPQPIPAGTASAVQSIDIIDPFIVGFQPIEYREPYIDIVHNTSGDVVTVIEVLSPADKSGEDHNRYHQKREEILHSHTHLVEIDLLSQGQHSIAVPKSALINLPLWRYIISVSRVETRAQQAEVYPIALKQSLPGFRIPLQAPDPDTAINLQAVFDQSYDNGGYAGFIDYDKPPNVPIPMAEREEALAVSTDMTGSTIPPAKA